MIRAVIPTNIQTVVTSKYSEIHMKGVHIKHLDLGHNLIIENDNLTSILEEGVEEQSQTIDEAFADQIEMGDKIDKYYEEHGI